MDIKLKLLARDKASSVSLQFMGVTSLQLRQCVREMVNRCMAGVVCKEC